MSIFSLHSESSLCSQRYYTCVLIVYMAEIFFCVQITSVTVSFSSIIHFEPCIWQEIMQTMVHLFSHEHIVLYHTLPIYHKVSFSHWIFYLKPTIDAFWSLNLSSDLVHIDFFRKAFQSWLSWHTENSRSMISLRLFLF